MRKSPSGQAEVLKMRPEAEVLGARATASPPSPHTQHKALKERSCHHHFQGETFLHHVARRAQVQDIKVFGYYRNFIRLFQTSSDHRMTRTWAGHRVFAQVSWTPLCHHHHVRLTFRSVAATLGGTMVFTQPLSGTFELPTFLGRE
jgi:hypothetical protein